VPNGALVYFKIKTIAFALMYGEAGPLPIVVEHLQEFPKLTHNLDFFGKIEKKNALQQFPISTPIFPYLGKSCARLSVVRSGGGRAWREVSRRT
jgi:hypothetical protein